MKERAESGQSLKSLAGYGFESVTPEHMFVLDLPSAPVKRPSDDLPKALRSRDRCRHSRKAQQEKKTRPVTQFITTT